MARRDKGDGSVYQRKDGRWVGRVEVDGKRKAFYAVTKAEARTKVRNALRDKEQGLLIASPTLPISRYLEWWLENSARQSVRPRTYECYDLCVRRITPYIGRLRLTALKPADVQGLYAALLERGLSRRTVELTHAVLHRALKDALRLGLIGRNCTEAATVPRPERREMRTLSREQVRALFASTKNDRLHALWVLLATSGLRIGEALGLKWGDFNFTTNRVSIQRALQSRKLTGHTFVEPKTRQSRRTVLLPPSVSITLKEHRRRQLEERLQAGAAWQEMDLVFSNQLGQPLNATSTVSKTFHRALAQAGLPRVRLHDLRHTAASLLLADGVHPKQVQEMLGHSTIMLTLDLYSHTVAAMHEEAAAKMERLFQDEPETSLGQ